ncbi:MAG TPA: hypothetical protein VL361_25625, partial [Candidatus Limnocylindrales bacterium]|nr:hypothetical protein [Candidatus Limnocylindrales bacterium]
PAKVVIPVREFNAKTRFSLLDGKTFLKFESSDEGPVLTIPSEAAAKPNCEHAWVIRMEKAE